MSTQKNKKQSRSVGTELERAKAQLEKFYKEDTDILIGKGNEFLTDLDSGKTYGLNHLKAFRGLKIDLDCDLDEIPEYVGFVLEDLTEFVLGHIDVPEYQRHRRLLQNLSQFFSDLLEERKGRPLA